MGRQLGSGGNAVGQARTVVYGDVQRRCVVVRPRPGAGLRLLQLQQLLDGRQARQPPAPGLGGKGGGRGVRPLPPPMEVWGFPCSPGRPTRPSRSMRSAKPVSTGAGRAAPDCPLALLMGTAAGKGCSLGRNGHVPEGGKAQVHNRRVPVGERHTVRCMVGRGAAEFWDVPPQQRGTFPDSCRS